MDFIERIFGFSPDGGAGSLEMMLLLVPVVVATLVMVLRKRSNFRRSNS